MNRLSFSRHSSCYHDRPLQRTRDIEPLKCFVWPVSCREISSNRCRMAGRQWTKRKWPIWGRRAIKEVALETIRTFTRRWLRELAQLAVRSVLVTVIREVHRIRATTRLLAIKTNLSCNRIEIATIAVHTVRWSNRARSCPMAWSRQPSRT